MSEPTHPWSHLEAPVLAVLRGHPAGLSEFDLIRVLQREHDLPEFAEDALREPLSLYRTHFILFHVLYRLDDRLAGETVEVGCLRCRIVRHTDGEAQGGEVGRADPMRAFYLDTTNLDGMDGEQVERLLDGFWRLFRGDARREDALAVLGLSDPVGEREIKAAYRRLAMRHHPDRGGETARLQELHDAMRVLGMG